MAIVMVMAMVMVMVIFRLPKTCEPSQMRHIVSGIFNRIAMANFSTALRNVVVAYAFRLFRATLSANKEMGMGWPWLAEELKPIFMDVFNNKRTVYRSDLLVMAMERNEGIVPLLLSVVADATQSASSLYAKSQAFVVLEATLKRHASTV